MTASSRSRLSAALFIAATALPECAAAQTLHVAVRDSVTGRPLPGAVVSVLDSLRAVKTSRVVSDRGDVFVHLPPGSRRVRVVRIGFRARELPLPASMEDLVDLPVTLIALPSLLEPVESRANANCPRRSDDGAAWALLEQARAALLNLVVSRDSNPAAMKLLGFDRRLGGKNDAIVWQSVRIDSTARSSSSFHAGRSAADLVRFGFAADSGGGRYYYGPDADVLLDDAFAGGYCFRVVRDRGHVNQVGLAFAPARGGKNRIDIDGTLWIDTVARTMRNIEYKYLGLSDEMNLLRPGGMTTFREMANGVVVIDQWWSRLPFVSAEKQQAGGNAFVVKNLVPTQGGGTLASAQWPDGTSWHAPLATLDLTTLRRDGSSAAGTRLFLEHTDYASTVQGSRFLIGDLLPGPYSLVVHEPRLDSLEVSLPPVLSFVAAGDSTIKGIAQVPTLEQYVADRCEKKHPSWVRDLAVFGQVFDTAGHPVERAEVTMSASAADSSHGKDSLTFNYQYKTGSDGTFELCAGEGWLGHPMTVAAMHDRMAARPRAVQFSPRLIILRIVLDSLIRK